MGLKRMNWQEYLYGTYERLQEDQTTMRALSQNIRIHNHTYGILSGASVLATSPTPDLIVHAQVGWVVDQAGKEIILSEIFDVNLTAYVPEGEDEPVYIVAEFAETQVTPYVVAETGEVKYAYQEETPTVTAQTAAPSGNQVELARVLVGIAATAISNAGDPLAPAKNQIDLRSRVYSYVRSTWMDNQSARFGSGQDASVYYDGSDLILDPSVLGSGRVLIGATGTKELVAYIPYQPYHIHGLQCGNPMYGPDEYVNIFAGGARDSTDTDNMDFAGAVKGIDAEWTVGTQVGGLDNGAVAANKLYAIWLIKRSNTGVVDALFSLSFTAPTMPANYDLKRLIGAVRTDATSDLVPFKQVGDHFTYLWNDTPVADLQDSNIVDNDWVTAAIVCPPNCLAHVRSILGNPTSTNPLDGNLYISAVPPAAWTGGGPSVAAEATGFDKVAGMVDVLTNSTSQIRYAAAQASGDAVVTLYTVSFEMLTRSSLVQS